MLRWLLAFAVGLGLAGVVVGLIVLRPLGNLADRQNSADEPAFEVSFLDDMGRPIEGAVVSIYERPTAVSERGREVDRGLTDEDGHVSLTMAGERRRALGRLASSSDAESPYYQMEYQVIGHAPDPGGLDLYEFSYTFCDPRRLAMLHPELDELGLSETLRNIAAGNPVSTVLVGAGQ